MTVLDLEALELLELDIPGSFAIFSRKRWHAVADVVCCCWGQELCANLFWWRSIR
jgi:hypothetical protein